MSAAGSASLLCRDVVLLEQGVMHCAAVIMKLVFSEFHELHWTETYVEVFTATLSPLELS